MDRKTRIRDMVAWQDFYNQHRAIVATYEDDEKKLAKLTAETEALEQQKEAAQTHLESLTQKLESESIKLENVFAQMDTMDKDRDNLKMARQIKSWEKDMERYSQDKEVLEAQIYYDKSKQGDLVQNIEDLESRLNHNKDEIMQLGESLSSVKAETEPERIRLLKEIEDVSSRFDSHFMEYFDRLLLKNKGSVLSLIEEDACSECNIQLPSSYLGGSDLQELEDTALLQCPNCFRYLYGEEVFED